MDERMAVLKVEMLVVPKASQRVVKMAVMMVAL